MTLISDKKINFSDHSTRARCAATLALSLMLWGAWAEAEPPANGPMLQEISSSSLPGGKVQIKLGLSALAAALLAAAVLAPAPASARSRRNSTSAASPS